MDLCSRTCVHTLKVESSGTVGAAQLFQRTLSQGLPTDEGR